MNEPAAPVDKPEADAKASRERAPLWWGLAIGTVILSLAVGYKIVSSDGAVDFQTGVDGIQVKISQAEKTIASAQLEMSDAQRQLNEREGRLAKREQELREREAKVQELLTRLERTAATPRPSPALQQAQADLQSLRVAAPVASAASEPLSLKPRMDKLDQLRSSLAKTSIELKAASKSPPVR